MNFTRRDISLALCGLVASLRASVLDGQKPAPNIESSMQRQIMALDVKTNAPQKRPWVISNRMVKILALEPASVTHYFALTVLGEDGKRYPIDDVLYGVLTVLENHLFAVQK